MIRRLILKLGRIIDSIIIRRELNNASIKHEKLGTKYGGWYIPTNMLCVDSTCYCAGAGEDISFDVELIERYECEVYVFDPTPRAKLHYDELVQGTRRKIKTKINKSSSEYYNISKEMLNHLHYYEHGLWSKDEIMRFYLPRNQKHVSCSIVNLQATSDYFEAKCFTVKSLMAMLNTSTPNLLKIDIEGAEYGVLESILRDEIHPDILCVEYDESRNSNLDNNYLQRILGSIRNIKEAGYLMTCLDNSNVTFIYSDSIDGISKNNV